MLCEHLEATVGLTAETLLDASRPKKALLHDEFEWNNRVAAELYRKEQARYIIRMLCVKPTVPNVCPVRAFFNVENTYTSIVTIMSSADSRNALLDSALHELSAFRRKYSTLGQLARLFDLIDELNKQMGGGSV